MNRPASLNALTLGMVEDLAAALRRWADDPAVIAVVIALISGVAVASQVMNVS